MDGRPVVGDGSQEGSHLASETNFKECPGLGIAVPRGVCRGPAPVAGPRAVLARERGGAPGRARLPPAQAPQPTPF